MSNYFDLSSLDISKPRVRCNGKSLDKCSLSSLIHEIALHSKVSFNFPLWSDIYWDSSTYSDLKDYLKRVLIVSNIL